MALPELMSTGVLGFDIILGGGSTRFVDSAFTSGRRQLSWLAVANAFYEGDVPND